MQQTQFFPFIGGENLSQPAITLQAGELLSSSNYECLTTGGYRRIDGYERFDGHESPTDVSYIVLAFTTGTVEFVVGDTVTGLTSGATGVVVDIAIDTGTFTESNAVGTIAIADVTGVFVDAEQLQVSGVTNAVCSGGSSSTSGDDTTDDRYYQSAIEYARSKIQALPGSGPVRGVFFYNDVVYAFRDDISGTACVMYKSTASGWVVVTTPPLAAGGKYEFIEYNFLGSSSTKRIYGVSGVNKAFEFDGTTYTELTTGMTADSPKHIAAFKKYLFLSFEGGSVQHSGLGDPTSWTPVTGAAEIATGDEIVGLLPLVGDTLAIFNRNRLYLLQGSSPSNWNLVEFSDESGANEWSIQRVGGGMFLDDRGLTTLNAVQAYGDFNSASISQKIDKKLRGLIATTKTSVRIKTKDQYRVFFNDGTGVCTTYSGNTLIGFTTLNYVSQPEVMYSAEDSLGKERVFFGDSNGFIYEDLKGTSMDGLPVVATIRFAFNHIGSPAQNKRFYKVTMEVEGGKRITLKYTGDFSYGETTIPVSREQDISTIGAGGFWDLGTWDEMVWDGQTVATVDFYTNGIGKSLSMFLYSEQIYESPHTLQGAIIYYSGRGLVR